MGGFIVTGVFFVFLQIASVEGDCFKDRLRRRLGNCWWGSVAVSACFQNGTRMHCNRGYECDPTLPGGRCCLPNANTSKCADGNSAVSNCFSNGTCGAGFECNSTEKQCCKSAWIMPIAIELTTANSNFTTMTTAKPHGCAGDNETREPCDPIDAWCPNNQYCSNKKWCCETRCPGGPELGQCKDGKFCNDTQICINEICCDMARIKCKNNKNPSPRTCTNETEEGTRNCGRDSSKFDCESFNDVFLCCPK